MNTKSILCVVRSVGERTTDPCIEQWKQQGVADIDVIRNRKFKDALRACFEAAIESEKELLLTCDADVVPYEGALDQMLKFEKILPRDFFQFFPLVEDYLSFNLRSAGVRMYRVKYLERALEFLDLADGFRPEGSVARSMSIIGIPSAASLCVIGTHDRYQYYADIYRTAIFYAKKHPGLISFFENEWTKSSDDDFRVALMGLDYGRANNVDESTSPDRWRKDIREKLLQAGIKEKSPLVHQLPIVTARWSNLFYDAHIVDSIGSLFTKYAATPFLFFRIFISLLIFRLQKKRKNLTILIASLVAREKHR